ncbi:NADP-dependent 3-hydroxy acid dehydrogenase YdfG [Paenibacillus sp. SORGH_AS306]|uniref:SDR family NAD(P)-dependent oxidoreductase n=1 Tax=Paenibacillus kyungheensis TaxID=1452732 RepID=A0AAX3LVJ6_9BACL|nr:MULTISPECIES: SDR family NAD(P)-dependent oxidoreductase [Paenibacillus]MDQ1234265.1 NADP-dependent 3-hydroxy acid dehydrogenase YdfG [Paenibacillus sp. SORGH_AS_0306]MDR6111311.1 NADP-dependent 3-hydroxy acid dehydrogenase YdfG [Paenibacillus sp. SORGH_AS_0338]WCT53884.1 SDR family NAD(P)-dependent oxidoreductase [Paenibacillus kyungheensis]WDF48751.1 SDR family NAD(P)-dependent oxidoreductase [Paenibacillus sp. KACC 21273]
MAQKLQGTVALVTGASSGIGEATAKSLAAQGATVVVVARRKDRLDQLATEISEQGGSAFVIEADITDQAQAQKAIEQTISKYNRLDIVVNNAGVMLLGPAENAPAEEWERMVSINVNGLLHISHAALPHLLKAAEQSDRQVADLINISSVAGRRAGAGSAVYNMTKFGVVAFSEALRQEVTGRGVRVGLIEPGVVQTELSSHVRSEVMEDMGKLFGNITPLEAQDIADAIEYVVTRPKHVAINEVLIRPTQQEF